MIAGMASIHGCIGAVDPVRTFGTPEQKERFLPEAGQRPGPVRLRPDRAGGRLGPHRPAHHGRPRRRRLRPQRREAVHHQRRPRPHGRRRGADRRQAGRAGGRSAGRRRTSISASRRYGLYALRQAYNNGLIFKDFRVPQGQPAQAAGRRRPDHRLPRPEPRPAVAVCRGGRAACA